MSKIVVYLIKNIWQRRLSEKYKKKYNVICRFYPTCSDYSIMALKKYGLVKGIKESIKRIRKCKIENTDTCYDCP
jgi:hypothetical protein